MAGSTDGGSSGTGLSRPRIAGLLTAVVTAALAVIAALLIVPHGTVIEIDLVTTRAEMDVVPLAADCRTAEPGDRPDAHWRVDLLEAIPVQALEVRGADRALLPRDAGAPVELASPAGGVLRFTSPEPFEASLQADGPVRIAIDPEAPRRGSPAVRIVLRSAAPPAVGPARPGGWRGTVQPLAAVDVAAERGPLLRIPDTAEPAQVRGGTRESQLGLLLPPLPQDSTRLRVIDPRTGGIQEHHLPFLVPAAQTLAWQDRLLLLEPREAPASTTLLTPDASVCRLRLFRPDPIRPVSFVLGGELRFPGGERAPVPLAEGSFLTAAAGKPFVLRSLRLHRDRLEMRLQGEASRLQLGPTRRLQSEQLPSLFAWLSTHHLRAVIGSTLASIVGLTLAFLRLLGLFKS